MPSYCNDSSNSEDERDHSGEFEVEVQKELKPPEKETDPRRIAQRQKQIDYGKNTLGYQRYGKDVPRDSRSKGDPQTPDPYQVCSKRSFDGQIKKWRRLLHKYDEPEDGEEAGTTTHGAEEDESARAAAPAAASRQRQTKRPPCNNKRSASQSVDAHHSGGGRSNGGGGGGRRHSSHRQEWQRQEEGDRQGGAPGTGGQQQQQRPADHLLLSGSKRSYRSMQPEERERPASDENRAPHGGGTGGNGEKSRRTSGCGAAAGSDASWQQVETADTFKLDASIYDDWDEDEVAV